MGIGREGVGYKVLMGLDPVAIRAYPPHVCVMWLRKFAKFEAKRQEIVQS